MGHYEEEHIEIIKYLVDTSKTLIKAVDYIERNLYGFKTREILEILEEGIESMKACKRSLKVLPKGKGIKNQMNSTEAILNLFIKLRHNFYDGDVEKCSDIVEKHLEPKVNGWKSNLENNFKNYTIN